MLAFIKKKIGLSPDTEEQCTCCHGGSRKTEETPATSCGCGGDREAPDPAKEVTRG